MDSSGKFENPQLLTRQPQRPSTILRVHQPGLHLRGKIVHITSLMKSRRPLIFFIRPMKQERRLRILPNIHAAPLRLYDAHGRGQCASGKQHARKYDLQPQDPDIGCSDAELATEGVVAGIADVTVIAAARFPGSREKLWQPSKPEIRADEKVELSSWGCETMLSFTLSIKGVSSATSSR